MQSIPQMPSAGNPILVIDDSNTIRRSAEIFLGQAGYTVVLADDGFAALSVILERKPALVFCDIQMPRLDGFQTCALIRRHPEFRQVPVVLLSSRDGVLDRARGMLAGASAYLTKPFTKESLLRTVSEQLSAVVSLPSGMRAPVVTPTDKSASAFPGTADPQCVPQSVPQSVPPSVEPMRATELSLLITETPSP